MLKEIRVIVLVRREGAHEYYVTSSSVAEGRRKREKRENTPERRVTFRVKRRGEREREVGTRRDWLMALIREKDKINLLMNQRANE